MLVSEAAGCCGVHIIRDLPGDGYDVSAYYKKEGIEKLTRLVKENENLVGVLQVNLVTPQKAAFGDTLIKLGFKLCASGINSKTGCMIYTYLRSRPVSKKKSKLMGWEKK